MVCLITDEGGVFIGFDNKLNCKLFIERKRKTELEVDGGDWCHPKMLKNNESAIKK